MNIGTVRRILCIALASFTLAATSTYLANAAADTEDGHVDESFIAGPGFDDSVLDMAFQGDEKIIAVGRFTSAVGVPSRRIVRLDAFGRIDQTFKSGTGADGAIGEVEVLPDGRILIAGDFANFDGIPVKGIARLNADGSLDRSFPNGSGPNSSITAMRVDNAGRILISGQFTSVNGLPAGPVARLDAAGDLDTSFVRNGGPNSFLSTPGETISCLEVLANGRIMIGGYFRLGLIRLLPDGAYDATFNIFVDGQVDAIHETPHGLYAAGNFLRVDGSNQPGIFRISGNTVDRSFLAPRARGISDFAVQADGKIVVGGFLLSAQSEDYSMARLNPDGSEEPGYLGLSAGWMRAGVSSVLIDRQGNAVFGGSVNEVTHSGAHPAGVFKFDPAGNRVDQYLTQTAAVSRGARLFTLADGRMLSWNATGYWRPRLARLSAEGIVDGQFAPPVADYGAVIVQPDGTAFVGGTYSRQPGPFKLRRVRADGTIDPNFTSYGTYSESAAANIRELAVQPDGKLIAVGDFDTINDQPRRDIVRLMPDGSIDQTFSVNVPSLEVYKVLTTQTGRIFIAVQPYQYVSWNDLYELDQSGAVIWRSRIDAAQQWGSIFSMELLKNGSLLIGGAFTRVNTLDAPAIAQIRPDGELDLGFRSPNLASQYSTINSTFELPDGRIMIGGQFASVDGSAHINLARLKRDGTVDISFNANAPGGPVISIVQQVSGKLVIGGNFETVNGRPKQGIARFQRSTQGTLTPNDFDGDGKTDPSIYRPSSGVWSLSRSQAGFYGQTFGAQEDKIVPADYDGDGKTDIAVFRPSNGVWYIANSGSNTFQGGAWGNANDIPAPRDFDGDGKADIAIFRPSDGTWWINQTGGGGTKVVQYGQNGDVPVVGDYDGDGKADIAVFRPSTGVWSINRSSAGEYGIAFGQNGDKVVPGDYDGDGKTDVAVFRPSTGVWYMAKIAANAFATVQFGNGSDIPVPGDYDGDGKTDQAVFRPSDGNWWLNRSSAGVTVVNWGQNGDKPTPAAYVN